MTNSSTFVSGTDEFLQRFAGIDQASDGESLLAGKASPQPDETSTMTGKPHRACGVCEFGLKESVLPLRYRRNVKGVGYAHTAGTDQGLTICVPIWSNLHGRFGAWP